MVNANNLKERVYMRKVTAIEVVALVGSLIIGNGNTHAAETLGKITVVGFTAPAINNVAGLSYGSISVPSYYTYGINMPQNFNAEIQQALKCANAYSANPQKYPTYFTAQYGFVNGSHGSWTQWTTSWSSIPPSGWQTAYGITYQWSPTIKETQIFYSALLTDMANLVGIIAHEWAHQNGWGESFALNFQADAVQNYTNTGGSECN